MILIILHRPNKKIVIRSRICSVYHMLEQTFIHIPGIGRRTEHELWRAGITSWDDFTDFFTRPAAISAGLRRRLETHIPQSIEAVQRKDAAFFRRLSSLGEAWRLFPAFASQCVFLDIE